MSSAEGVDSIANSLVITHSPATFVMPSEVEVDVGLVTLMPIPCPTQ